MAPRWVYELIALPAIFLPVIVAVYGFKPGGGVWKFLALLFCTMAAAFVLLIFHPIAAFIAWMLAWPCTAAARSDVQRVKLNEMLRLLGEGPQR